ncbi:response regulator [Ramlibacter tataouinensis]|uniref:Sensory/regulatory protein RpfC n=1 Tax=Ramlibacter tataouinensis (strain ATCC BAA-407 / DSM 14655 / LMG 21543 / TTB310) TaxID=365046 RepID=F5XVN0_RAMTT|nr:response regulator [Ramlibacter tataouinensis]AEG91606.1 candidate histidine kinase, unorthodox [Ramlibacter tataouinensis TTB310]
MKFPRRAAVALAGLMALALLVALATALITLARVTFEPEMDAQQLAWRDSMTGMAFGLERQFLLFRGELGMTLAAGSDPVDLSAQQQRLDVLASRVNLMRNSSTLSLLQGRREHQQLLVLLDELIARGDELLAAGRVPRSQALQLMQTTDHLLPQVQQYATAATLGTSDLLDGQFRVVRRQTVLIGTLALAQLVLLALTVHAVRARLRQEAGAQQRLQQLADELREAKLAAEAASRTKSQFLANMSHELRTPLQGVLGMTQLLGRTPLTGEQRDLIATADESAQHLLVVLNEILDLSAIEAGKIVLHEAPVQLPKLCRDVEGLMRLQAEAHMLVLVADMAPDLPDWVRCDGTRVKQVLFNLLNNAIKFTPAGQVRLAVSAEPPVGGRWRLRFEVADTGIGMDEATQARLFQRFEPGHTGLSRRYSGTGLGLEISRNLARLMGGDLVASSQPGQGSVFVLTLLLGQAEAPAEAPAVLATARSQPLRVLVADDHPVNRRYLGAVLRSIGHEVTLCDNGEEALEIVQTDRFDAVLMDIHMPVMDGLAATRAIRALGGRYADLPVVALTADVMPGARLQAVRAGISAFLSKPVGVEQLSAVLGDASEATASAAPTVPAASPADVLSARFEEMAARLPPAQWSGLVEAFVHDEAGAYAALSDALVSASAAAVGPAAHKFKGSARLLGLDLLAAAAEAAERWAREDRTPDGAAQAGRRLEQAWQATCRQLQLRMPGHATGAALPRAA